MVTMVRWGVRCVVVWRTYLSSSNSLDSALLPLSDLSSSELVNRKLVSLTLSLSHLQQYGRSGSQIGERDVQAPHKACSRTSTSSSEDKERVEKSLSESSK